MLETVLLSIYNHDSAIASAASRMTAAAGDRPCIEMGARRTQELAAVAAARAAYIAGFEATSNLEAGRRYGVPTRGTSAHAFTLLHGTEREAFAAQVAALGEDTTLLVDTYDVIEAVRTGVELTGAGSGAVRLDSGDLLLLATAGAPAAGLPGRHQDQDHRHQRPRRVAIAALAGAPVDGYGVGTAAGHRQRPPDLRLRLQAGRPRRLRRRRTRRWCRWRRRAPTRSSIGGRKCAAAPAGRDGVAEAEVIGIGAPPTGDHDDRDAAGAAGERRRDRRRGAAGGRP